VPVVATKTLKHILVKQTRLNGIWRQESGTANQDMIMWISNIGYPTIQCWNLVDHRSALKMLGSLSPHLPKNGYWISPGRTE